MGCSGAKVGGEGDGKYQKGGENDISSGPLKKRGCTDIICLILFIVHWFVFIAVVFAGVSDGNPTKLYKPRDFRGDYCGVKKQWNSGLNLEDQVKMTYTMNVTHSVDNIAKQLVCSSSAEAALNSLMSADQLTNYRCACCKSACSSCYGSYSFTDLASPADAGTVISGKMTEITGATNAGNLFSPSGANGDYFANMWSQATIFFNAVCLPKCNDPASINFTSTSTRTYTYSPPPGASWQEAWQILGDSGPTEFRNLIQTSFTFKALPLATCPYEARYCVPFPGVEFLELANDHCTFKAGLDVVNAVGEAAAETFESLGANDVSKAAESSFGSAFGDAMNTIDALIVVGICSLVIGLVFLVLLRFFVGAVVWTALFLVVVFFAVAGGFLWIRSAQCKGAGLFESGKQMGVAATMSAAGAASGSTASEDFTGNGADYRGVQTRTVDGFLCQRWDAQSPHQHSVTPSAYSTSGLVDNYCRNPTTGPTIWCFTMDADTRWQTCSPVGVVRPECVDGYVVESETARKIMEVCGIIIWCFGALWIVLVCFLRNRIRLAIAINKCAAMFVYNTPQVLLVPLVQVFVGLIWVCVWALCASFLLSQVPADYTPTAYYESYAIAYGTEDVPGKCTDKWPTGAVWKDEGDLSATDNPCSGNMGDTSAITPKCWRCYPPRYIFDVRFAAAFFSLLWNNAFLIALGQCIIAGAVCVWFFAPRSNKMVVKSVSVSTWNCFRFHTGSLAFGAFILAVVQFIRYWLMYLEKQAAAQKNRVMVLIMKVLQCCMWCLEKCIKFLNKNAYIQVAIMGTNFCVSAKNAFMLITRNFLRFGVVATLGSIIHFLGFIFIMVCTCLLGYFILQGLHPDVYPVVPVIMYVVVSYLVAKLYMNVFGLAVDTTLQCFIATEEMGGDEDFVPGPMKMFFQQSAGAAGKDEADGGAAT